MKYLIELPAHDPKIYAMKLGGCFPARAHPRWWIDEHGKVRVEKVLLEQLAKYEKTIANWKNPKWVEQRILAWPDHAKFPPEERIKSWEKRIADAKAKWKLQGHRTAAMYASESLKDKEAYNVFWNYERYWRRLDDPDIVDMTDVPLALIEEIEERYGVDLIVARAASKIIGDWSNGRTADFDSVSTGSNPVSPTIDGGWQGIATQRLRTIKKLEAENKKLKKKFEERIKNLEAARKTYSDAHTAVLRDKYKLETENKKLKQQGEKTVISKKDRELNDMEIKIEKLEAKLAEYEEKFINSAGNIDTALVHKQMIDEIKKLEAENKALKMGQETPVDWKATVEERQKIIDELQAENEELKKQINALTTGMEDVERETIAEYQKNINVKKITDAGKLFYNKSGIGRDGVSKEAIKRDMDMIKKIAKTGKGEAPTHKFKYSLSYTKGSYDVLSIYIDIINLKTGQSDTEKFSEKLNGVDRTMIVGVQDYSGGCLRDEMTGQTASYRKAMDFTYRGQALIKMKIPDEFRDTKKLILSIQIQENQDEKLRKVDEMEIALWCPPIEKILYMNQSGNSWLIHKNPEMFKELGGHIEPKKELSPEEAIMEEVHQKARLMEAKGAKVWEEWQKIFDFMMGNRPDVNGAELLAEIKAWHEKAKVNGWKPALETLPKVIAFLEVKR